MARNLFHFIFSRFSACFVLRQAAGLESAKNFFTVKDAKDAKKEFHRRGRRERREKDS